MVGLIFSLTASCSPNEGLLSAKAFNEVTIVTHSNKNDDYFFLTAFIF